MEPSIYPSSVKIKFKNIFGIKYGYFYSIKNIVQPLNCGCICVNFIGIWNSFHFHIVQFYMYHLALTTIGTKSHSCEEETILKSK